MTHEYPSAAQMRHDLQTKHYTQLPAILPDHVLVSGMQAFLAFLRLPQKTKDRFKMNLDESDPRTDSGYKLSDPKDGELDHKEFFHWNSQTEKQYGHHADCVPEAREFFYYSNLIAAAGRLQFRQIVTALRDDYPELYRRYVQQNGVPQDGIARWLAYVTQSRGAMSAKGHFDRSGFSEAMIESDTGLFMAKDEKSPRTPVQHAKDHFLFFLGHKGPQVCPDLRSAYHGVEQTGEVLSHEKYSRFALVMFFADENSGTVSHAATHPGLYTK